MSDFLDSGPNKATFVGAERGKRGGGRRLDDAGRDPQDCMVFAKRRWKSGEEKATPKLRFLFMRKTWPLDTCWSLRLAFP